VLTRLLPAVVERDLAAFGAALTEVQKMIGACFATVQRGDFHPSGAALVRSLESAGACGVGQSSWGPAVYAFAEDDAERKRLLKTIRDVDPVAEVITTRGWNQGAAIDGA
jgi:beta-RFAP synthase